MTTSGTVAQTTIPVIDIIDHSILRCGISPAKINEEMLDIARKNLYYYIMYLANKGVNLWTIERTLIGLLQGQSAYSLPAGTVDVLNLLYRTLFSWTGDATSSAIPSSSYVAEDGTTQYVAEDGTTQYVAEGPLSSTLDASAAFDQNINTFFQQSGPNGNIWVDFGSPMTITTVGFMPYGNDTYSLAWECSEDNVNWVTVSSQSNIAMTDGQWYYYDVLTPQSGEFFRVRETNGATISVREIVFGWMETEIPVSRSNRDDFSALPNKTFQSRLPTEYWYNRLIDFPQVVVWPTPSDFTVMLVAWQHRQIQDIGDFTNTIEVPQRWYDCILANLAHRNSLDIVGVEPDRIDRLERLAMKAEEPPFDEERDKAPSFFTPNIGYYTGTRGSVIGSRR